MKEEKYCFYARFTTIQWNFTNYPENRNKCRIVKCRHPDAVKAAQQFNESQGKQTEWGIFGGLEGTVIPHDKDFKTTGEECLYRRSRFCNSSCPGYKEFVLEDSSSVEKEALE